MHHYITSNRFGIDVDAPVIRLLPGLVPNNTLLNRLSNNHAIIDADERIRISVYDYDFGMWDAKGLCMSICLVVYFSRFDR